MLLTTSCTFYTRVMSREAGVERGMPAEGGGSGPWVQCSGIGAHLFNSVPLMSLAAPCTFYTRVMSGEEESRLTLCIWARPTQNTVLPFLMASN